MKGKKVFVAGGTGLIGTNLTQRLVQLDCYVSSSFFSKPPKFENFHLKVNIKISKKIGKISFFSRFFLEFYCIFYFDFSIVIYDFLHWCL